MAIFTKLRELNFCLNAAKSNLSFLKSKIRKIICKEEKVVRFFYLITDSLFAEAEQRTKFFDFIIPVVPVLNSYNSRQKLEDFFKAIDEEKKPEKELLSHICFYINDMRLLKNVINEYKIYIKVIDIESKNLKIDNLFSIILIKNLFPREYDQLLKNEGVIFDAISKIENCNETDFITFNLDFDNNEEEDQELKELKDEDLAKLIFKQKKDNLIKYGKIQEIFQEAKCYEEKYGLIRYLILNDFLDSNYFYYLGFIYEGSLSKKDQIFLKKLREGDEFDIFYELENSNNVYEELTNKDFSRVNILNFYLLNEIIRREDKNKIIKLFSLVEENNKIDIISRIFVKLEFKQIKWIISALSFKFKDVIIKIIKWQNKKEKKDQEEQKKEELMPLNVLLAICVQGINDNNYEKLMPYKELLENKSSLLEQANLLSDLEKEILIRNFVNSDIKFASLENLSINKNILSKIENNNLFKLTSSNLKYLLINLENKKDASYSTMISDLYNSEIMQSSKNYLEKKFDNFIENDYILTVLYATKKLYFKNNEKETIKILNANLDTVLKWNYIENNRTIINDISEVQNDYCLEWLFQLNQIYLSDSNIKIYWKIISKNLGSNQNGYRRFDEYLNKNFEIQPNKLIEIMQNNLNICGVIINWETLDDLLFNELIEFNNKKNSYQKISSLNSMLNKNKITKLAEHNLIDINQENCLLLFHLKINSFFKLVKYKKNKNDFFQLIRNNSLSIEKIQNSELFSLDLLDFWFKENDILTDLNKTEILRYYFQFIEDNHFYNYGITKLKKLISNINSLKGFEDIFNNKKPILEDDKQCKNYLAKFLKEKNLIGISKENRINLKPAQWKQWKK